MHLIFIYVCYMHVLSVCRMVVMVSFSYGYVSFVHKAMFVTTIKGSKFYEFGVLIN